MEERIGKINASIVRDLGLPEDKTESLVNEFECAIRMYGGVERRAAIYMAGAGKDYDLGLRYWKLMCERWDIRISDLAENDWQLINNEVFMWTSPATPNNGEILKWLHEKYELPRDAFVSQSHNAIYCAVKFKSIEAVKWLVENFNIDLVHDPWDHLTYLDDERMFDSDTSRESAVNIIRVNTLEIKRKLLEPFTDCPIEMRIGIVNAGIVRDLGLPEEETSKLISAIEEAYNELGGDERNAAYDVANSEFGSLQYWKAMCERWNITTSVLAENEWALVRVAIDIWLGPIGPNNGEILKWLHEKYKLPREALVINSHYAIYLAVRYNSIEAVEWLIENFDINLYDAYDHLGKMNAFPQQISRAKRIISENIKKMMPEFNIGRTNAEIVRSLELPSETYYKLLEDIRCFMSSTNGDGKEASLSAGIYYYHDVGYWKLVCEKWEVTLSDLEESGWSIIRELVEAWSNQHNTFDEGNGTAAGVLTWLHDKYVLPKEAFEYESHHATYHGVMKRSDGLLLWLKTNYAAFNVANAYKYAEYLYGERPQKLAEEKAKIGANIKELMSADVNVGGKMVPLIQA